MSSTTSQPATITLSLNGEPIRLEATNLAEAVEAAGYGGERFATALNGTFIPRDQRTRTPVADGDAIEVLTARQGG